MQLHSIQDPVGIHLARERKKAKGCYSLKCDVVTSIYIKLTPTKKSKIKNQKKSTEIGF